jgi:hypothetical protein
MRPGGQLRKRSPSAILQRNPIAKRRGLPTLDSYELGRLSDTLTREFTALAGRKPRGAKAALEDDILSYSFLDGLSPEEDKLRHQGRGEELRERREEGLEPVGLGLVPFVAQATRAQVDFHVELFDPNPNLTTILFGLGSTAEAREHLLAASAAMRAEARRLREQSVSIREAAWRIRARVRRDRERRRHPSDDGA